MTAENFLRKDVTSQPGLSAGCRPKQPGNRIVAPHTRSPAGGTTSLPPASPLAGPVHLRPRPRSRAQRTHRLLLLAPAAQTPHQPLGCGHGGRQQRQTVEKGRAPTPACQRWLESRARVLALQRSQAAGAAKTIATPRARSATMSARARFASLYGRLATVRYVLSLVAMYFCRLCAKKNCLQHQPTPTKVEAYRPYCSHGVSRPRPASLWE